MRRTRWAATLGLALGLCASVVRAEAETPEREAERTALFEEGLELAEAGRWSEAAERFRRVVAIRSAPRARFTLGEAEEKSGKLASAKASYALALEEARAAGDEPAAGAAGGALAAIERRVPRLLVRLGEPVQGARASVDGQEVELGERPVELDPGEHRLVVRAPGRKPFEQVVQASEGRTAELRVALEPEHSAGSAGAGQSGSRATPPISEDSAESGASAAPWGPPAGAWVLGATGLAATAVGIGLYVTGQSAYDEAAARCAAGGEGAAGADGSAAGCAQAGPADYGNGARGQMIAGDVVMAVGIGAVLGAGIWWAVTAGQGSAAEAPAQARLGVGVSRDGLALTLAWKP